MTTRKQVNLRLEQEVINKLQRQAEKERRSTNNMIEIMILDYLKRNNPNTEDENQTQ